MIQNIYGAYRKVMAGVGNVEVLKGNLTDEEAQAAIRGIGATKEHFDYFAKQDIQDWLNKNPYFKSNQKIKLQIKAECDERGSYLIYLNFIV